MSKTILIRTLLFVGLHAFPCYSKSGFTFCSLFSIFKSSSKTEFPKLVTRVDEVQSSLQVRVLELVTPPLKSAVVAPPAKPTATVRNTFGRWEYDVKPDSIVDEGSLPGRRMGVPHPTAQPKLWASQHKSIVVISNGKEKELTWNVEEVAIPSFSPEIKKAINSLFAQAGAKPGVLAKQEIAEGHVYIVVTRSGNLYPVGAVSSGVRHIVSANHSGLMDKVYEVSKNGEIVTRIIDIHNHPSRDGADFSDGDIDYYAKVSRSLIARGLRVPIDGIVLPHMLTQPGTFTPNFVQVGRMGYSSISSQRLVRGDSNLAPDPHLKNYVVGNFVPRPLEGIAIRITMKPEIAERLQNVDNGERSVIQLLPPPPAQPNE